jgi:glycosyltransferase involved in cell wall biosynthesis
MLDGCEVRGASPRALVIGPLPPPFGGVGVLVQELSCSLIGEGWCLDVFNLSKPKQGGKPSTVTLRDVGWTLWHLLALPVRLVRARPDVVLIESTADTGFFRDLALALECRAFCIPVVFHWHGAPDSIHSSSRARPHGGKRSSGSACAALAD